MTSDTTQLAFVGTPDVIRELHEVLPGPGARVSAPVAERSPTDVLDSPIGAEEIRQILEIITVISSTGVTVVALIDKVLSVLKKHAGSSVSVRDPRTGKTIGRLDAGTSPEQAKKLLGG